MGQFTAKSQVEKEQECNIVWSTGRPLPFIHTYIKVCRCSIKLTEGNFRPILYIFDNDKQF